MSNFLIFKAAFNNSATPAIGTYTAEGATAQFNRNTSISPDYYLYNTALYSAVQWFVPTAETTNFEFVADILTRGWDNRITYFIIADSTGTTRLRMWSVNDNWHFENSDSTATTGSPEFIGTISPTTSGGFGVFHQFRVRVRKLTESSSSVEVYVDGTLKLTATAGAALITCAKIGFVGGVNSFGPGTRAGIKNAYIYDLSGGDVIDRGVLSGAFNRFISWMKSKFALKSDIPTVNDATLTIQQNGTNVATFTANQSANATANITVPTAVSELTNDSGYLTSSSNLDASKLTSGTVDIARLPQGALERLVKVANEAARYALTTADVQLGDTVQQLDTGIMYVVTDTDHLDSAAGYTEYTAGTAASVPWSGVTGKPTFAAVATSGAYSDLTGTPTIPTVNNATLTIQRNGTTIDTFTANASVDKTININTADDTKIPLAGSNQISGSLIPSTDGTVNLGGTSYQWNNLYAKSYYYNGTQWGLDQANVWTGRQTYDAYLKSFGEARTDDWSGNSRTNAYLLSRRDTDDVSGFLINTFRSNQAQGTAMHIYGWDILENSTRYSGLRFTIDWDSTLNSGNGAYKVTLGTNTQGTNPCNDLHITQLKTINGINLGALSLPSNSYVNVDTTDWDVAGGTNVYTPPANGWLHIRVVGATELMVRWTSWGFGDRRVSATATDLGVTIPVVAGVTVDVVTVASGFDGKCQFFPCQGNV